jgi:hypothetical protein
VVRERRDRKHTEEAKAAAGRAAAPSTRCLYSLARVPVGPRAKRRMNSPEQKNYAEIARLEQLLGEVRANRSTARESEAIREIGFEIAVAIREVGAMLVNLGWEQTFANDRKTPDSTADD